MLYKPDVGQGMSQQNVFHGQIIAFVVAKIQNATSVCKNVKLTYDKFTSFIILLLSAKL